MTVIHLCPANLATGGTEGIHHLVSELSKCGADAKILYVGSDLNNPQPKEFEGYNCAYITEMPKDYKGVVIFPEVWGNRVIEPQYADCTTVINWQGVDVYNWNTPARERGKFLQRKDTMHITMSEYGMEYLKGLGLSPMKIPDCINDAYLEDYDDTEERSDIVLYNPTSVKMTQFQEAVMSRCNQKGIIFLPLCGYTQKQLIKLFRSSKLYIDFGAFSGRERLPREAVMCGCCILTSNRGTAKYYRDNAIPRQYKISDIDSAISMISYILDNYQSCKGHFDAYRTLMHIDKQEYPILVKEFYDAILSHSSST